MPETGEADPQGYVVERSALAHVPGQRHEHRRGQRSRYTRHRSGLLLYDASVRTPLYVHLPCTGGPDYIPLRLITNSPDGPSFRSGPSAYDKRLGRLFSLLLQNHWIFVLLRNTFIAGPFSAACIASDLARS